MPSGTPARARQDRNHVPFAHPHLPFSRSAKRHCQCKCTRRRSFLLQVSPPLQSGRAHGPVRAYHPCRGVERCRDWHFTGYELAHRSLAGVPGMCCCVVFTLLLLGFFILATLPADPQTTIGSRTSRDQDTPSPLWVRYLHFYCLRLL